MAPLLHRAAITSESKDERLKADVQFLGLVAIRQTDLDVWKVTPVGPRSQRNVLHPRVNQRTHLLADVVSQDRLILIPSDLTNTPAVANDISRRHWISGYPVARQ